MVGATAAVICNLTAQVRRFHDAELPAFLFLFIILLGDIPLLLLCMKGQAITSDRYTFQAPRERMMAFEQHFQQHQQEAEREEERDEAKTGPGMQVSSTMSTMTIRIIKLRIVFAR